MSEKRTIRVLRVYGIRPSGDTAYVDAVLRDDAPDVILEKIRKVVRDRFKDRYPDVIRVEAQEWTQEIDSDD